jgi:SAM-dependent methyltransferase
MNSTFDQAASTYDATFTHSTIGKAQRNLVYEHLRRWLSISNKYILEVNCGTGEDAIWLDKQGFEVIATDRSSKMIAVAETKKTTSTVAFVQADINGISEQFSPKKFDVVLSNFGGLNCLNPKELKQFFNSCNELVPQNGKLILVIMPKNTIWEKIYFILKGKWKTAFRRNQDVTYANVDGAQVPTYYYNPKDVIAFSQEHFAFLESQPIGFFIPPSYLEPFFKNKKHLLHLLITLETRIKRWSFLSKYADHYLLVLQKK